LSWKEILVTTIIIPLKHILLDPAKPLDLAAIPEHDAIELIRESYGFLSPAIQVTITDGIATIQFEEARGERISEALKQYQKAVSRGTAGELPEGGQAVWQAAGGNPPACGCPPQHGHGLPGNGRPDQCLEFRAAGQHRNEV
jgi:hypothetical protein